MVKYQNTGTIGMEIEVKELTEKLKRLVPVEYWNIFDWETIINRRTNIKDNIYCYNLFLYKVYLNNKGTPIEYKNQHIIDGMVFLDLNTDSTQGAGTYNYIGDMP